MGERCDCLIVGGGPAGAALACLLAQRGFAVHLVDHGGGPWSGPYETLLAPVHRLLERTGLARWVAPLAEPDPLRHGARWETAEPVWRDDGSAGLLLRRGPFDHGLRAAAAAAGAHVHAPARVRRERDGFAIVANGTRVLLQPTAWVAATGRSRGAWPPAAPVLRSGPRTVAFGLVGEPAACDRGTAMVEALADGWIWTHAPATGPAGASVLLDAARVAAIGATAAVHAALATARGPVVRLGQPRLRHAADATPREWAAHADELRIGDAAATVDPLASQGVEKAFAAADHAAAVLTTALAQPAWRARLFAAHARWEAGLFTGHAAAARAWYARVERFADAPFWAARRVRGEPVPTSIGDDVPLCIARSVQQSAVLVRAGERFVEQPGAIDAHTGDERSHVGFVPIPALLDRFTSPTSLRAATAAAGCDARLFVLPPRAVYDGLRALLNVGWLQPAVNAADSR